jgi:orotidine-5'-phosphate decarboxylase
MTFFDRLEERRRRLGTALCVGLDPRLDLIPADLKAEAGGDVARLLYRFGAEVIDLAGPSAACVKVQIAFFEAHGTAGMAAYARLLAEARSAGLPVVADVKRGDIGTTAEAYAAGHLTPGADFEADALTINPYLGEDAMLPFVRAARAHGKGLYVLVRTSNPGARDLQEQEAGDPPRPVYEVVARLVERLGSAGTSPRTGLADVGAVVGATAPAAGAALRVLLPRTPFLVPGYGAQGGGAQDVAPCFRADGSGAVVNASRSVIHPAVAEGQDWREAVARAAAAAREDLHGAHARG